MDADPTNDSTPEELHVYGESEGPIIALLADFDWVRLTQAEASTYLELRMLRSDLDFAIGVLTRLADTPVADTASPSAERDAQRDDHRARWNAALVAYMRPFMSGVGERRHAYYLRLRNRHVAHSVSEYEAADVLIALSRDHEPVVVGLLDQVTTEQSPGTSGVLDLLQLARAVRDHLARRLETERRRLLEYARTNVAVLAARERVTMIDVSQYDDDVAPRHRS